MGFIDILLQSQANFLNKKEEGKRIHKLEFSIEHVCGILSRLGKKEGPRKVILRAVKQLEKVTTLPPFHQIRLIRVLSVQGFFH